MRMVMRERIRGMGCAPVIWPMLIGIALMVGCGGEKVENGPLGSEEDASAQDTVVFADAGLEGAVRAALEKPEGSLAKEELLALKELDAGGREIADLSGIEWLEDLQILVLKDNRIADLSLLAELDRLQFLDLDNNRVRDISPLSGLTHLEGIILDNNEVIDLAPLLGLVELKVVECMGNSPGENSVIALRDRGVAVHWEKGNSDETVAGIGFGQRIAFVLSGDIHQMRIDGSNPIRLTWHPTGGREPSWSPDGRRIAFTTFRDGNSEIYLLEAGGGDPVNLTNDPASNYSPSWSPDGQMIAFVSNPVLENEDIYVMDANGGGVRQLTDHPGRDISPSWSPDGQMIVFASDRDGDFNIYVMGANGGGVRQLADHPGRDVSPSWSPDGKMIVFASEGEDAISHVHVMDANGTHVIQLTSGSSWNDHPEWSPDGRQIAFVSDRDEGNSPTFNIYVMDIDGSHQVKLTTFNGLEGFKLSWGADIALEFDDIREEFVTDLFADSRLEAGVRLALEKKAGEGLTEEDLLSITGLNLQVYKIFDLRGIESLKNLERLDLRNRMSATQSLSSLGWSDSTMHFMVLWNQVRDLTPLAGLTRLKRLDLYWNPIEDLSPLALLTRLTYLALGSVYIDDLSPISNLNQLVVLTIRYSQVKDLSPLADLKQLTELDLINNQIEDLFPLSQLPNLARLKLSGNQIRDVSPLLDLGKLIQVELKDNPLSEESLNTYVPMLRDRGVGVYL